ncbi:hypothetical protein, conserved [Babesia bigemina]|uniref:C3H1-type domain-containing protein n=1 Tax=Babesia bigemina TaxID=5866 RepID=A0A061BKD0_BABBI|nr:hypothetical protein, conserved [Babesia bigemina]CDR71930.1 hypothetical protein, conserved [Babesia bigemina]|eukprot:XP_012770872.1 hypothetical protein, conserved [Babesia bigemina]
MTSLNHNNNLCLVTLSFPSSTSCHCPDHVPPRELDKKFDKIQNLKNTSNNNPTNILTNLCTGLETFLGFNSSSKGYDGSGIVYSDLDRLCDGVMGFLSGVLGAVKDDPSVTTYYTKMDETLQKIKNNMHNPDGLSKAVEAVSRALGEWDGNLTSRTDALKNRLKTLNVDRFNEFDNSLKLLNSLLPEQLDQVPRQLQACITDAGAILTDFNFAEAEYDKLDDTLKDKLKNAMFQIKLQVEKFHGAATNTELRAVLDMAKDTWDYLREDINNRVRENIEALALSVLQKVIQIGKDMYEVDEILKKCISDYADWIRDTNNVLELAQKDALKISNSMTAKYNQEKLQEIATAMENWKLKLVDYVDVKVKPKLQELVKTSQRTVAGLDDRLKADLKVMEEKITEPLRTLKLVSGGFLIKITDTQTMLTKAIGNVFQDLVKLEKIESFDEIKNALGEIVSAPLLQKIASASAFTDLNKYFAALDSNVMDPLKKATQRIGEGIRMGSNANMDDFHRAFTRLKSHIITPLKEIKQVANGSVTDISGLEAKLQNVLGNDFTFSSFNLQSHISKLTDVINKLDGIGGKVDKQDAEKVLTDLGSIAKAVSSHSKTVIEKVIDSMEKNVKTEIAALARAIKGKITKCSNLAGSQGGTSATGDVSGLAKLATEFGANIDVRLDDLKNTVTSEAFKNMPNGAVAEINVDQTLPLYKGQRDEHVNTALEAINTFVSDISIQPTATNLTEWSQNITQNLDTLITEFAEVASYINGYINDLQSEKLDKKFVAILDKLRTLHQVDMRKLLEDIQKLRDFINDRSRSTIWNMQKFVTDKFAVATKTIQDTARRQYYTKLNEMFRTMERKVKAGIADINIATENDVKLGVKGLLSTVYDKEGVTLSRIKIDDPLYKENVKNVSSNLTTYLENILRYVDFNVAVSSTDPAHNNPRIAEQAVQVREIQEKINYLLNHLHKRDSNLPNVYNYDHQFTSRLSTLSSAISALDPQALPDAGRPVLRALKQGMLGFVGELEKGYVNRYDGGESIKEWVKREGEKDVLTPEGKNGAKVFLTILETLYNDLATLLRDCPNKWKGKKICLFENVKSNHKPVDNSLGQWFKRRGYAVSGEIDKQQGELRNKAECSSEQLLTLLSNSSGEKHVFKQGDPRKDSGPLKSLIGHLGTYYSVCHHYIPKKPKAPANIYQMLQWLCGLWHNPMRTPLRYYFMELFNKPKGREHESYVKIGSANLKLETYPYNVITPNNLDNQLYPLCFYAEMPLTAILGQGHAEGRYAVDFKTNAEELLYPSNPGACFDMFADILNRVYHQCNFLLKQCSYSTKLGGWSDCWYGNSIAGSSWSCNAIQCPGQGADQKHEQSCNQKCDQNAECGIKSPLQSFLEDGLQGFLPHAFTKPGCKLECTVSNHRGIPCKTPMGFADMSITSSHRQKGEHLKKALAKFCGPQSQLNVLCSLLTCMLRQPPQTLGDMFAFYCSFLADWAGPGKAHKQTAFNAAVEEAIFGQEYPHLNPTTLFSSKKHVDAATTHAKGDLLSLVSCNGGIQTVDPAGTCGPYLQPMNNDIYDVFAASNKKLYLSWIVYSTETFYDLLCRLLEDCKRKCATPQSRCKLQGCAKDCRAVLSDTKIPDRNHQADCKSIVQCNSTLPNLYKYGFYYGDSTKLSGDDGREKKRSCQDFCRALERVLNKNEQNEHVLAKFIFHTIPEFLFKIREPFIWLNVALWSLSVFYLICVMVGRLDVLHIRSHLRSPSSHRITAQSLLAAAQVGRLAKISYLQP